MHALITGASSGIGEALARQLSPAGVELTLVARRGTLLNALAADLGRCRTVVRDLADEGSEWLADLPPVDLLINNAGVQAAGPFARLEAATARRMLAVNLLAPISLTQAVLPAMLRRRTGQVVNVASLAALAPPPGMACYAATKGGLAAFSEALTSEVRGSGVQVLTVYPGPIDNGAPQASEALYGAFGRWLPQAPATDLAQAILQALAQRRSRLIYPPFYRPAWWLAPLVHAVVGRATPFIPGEST